MDGERTASGKDAVAGSPVAAAGRNSGVWVAVGAGAVMLLTPLFFSSNLVFGRWTVPEVAPATLAFLRWGAVALVLSPFALAAWRRVRPPLGLVTLLAALGMGVCGAVVYLALGWTTATNATLIYTTSPIFVLLIERARGTPLSAVKAVGCTVAMVGITVILFRGEPARILALRFNVGDALILACAIAWAGYSVAFRDTRLAAVGAAGLFGLIAGAGAVLLAPFALGEWLAGAPIPTTGRAWTGIAGIVVFSSLLAFGGYQFGLRRFGAQVTSVFMYLLPIYGTGLAVLFLGERVEPFHAAGIALVLCGVVAATLPARALPGEARKPR